MTALDQTSATLRIFGPGLDPDEITALLGKAPTGSTKIGDVKRSRSGLERVANVGQWNFSASEMTPGNLDVQVAEILDGMPEDAVVWKDLASKFHVDIFCGLFLEKANEGIAISSSTLRLLADRDIQLSLDIYDNWYNH